MCYKVGDLYRRSDIYDLLTGRFMPVDQIGAGLHYVTPDTAVVPRKLVEERVQRDHQQRLVDESRNR